MVHSFANPSERTYRVNVFGQAWKNALGNIKAKNYEELVKTMLFANLDWFPDYLRSMIDRE